MTSTASATPPAFAGTFAAVSLQLQQGIGHKLFTVSHVLPGGQFVERIYTSDPAAYPVHGQKPRDHTAWSFQMARGECFVANHPDDFGPHFSDLATIVGQGLGAVINMPILAGGRLMGTLNLLDAAGAYPTSAVDACLEVQALAARGFAEYEQSTATRPA